MSAPIRNTSPIPQHETRQPNQLQKVEIVDDKIRTQLLEKIGFVSVEKRTRESPPPEPNAKRARVAYDTDFYEEIVATFEEYNEEPGEPELEHPYLAFYPKTQRQTTLFLQIASGKGIVELPPDQMVELFQTTVKTHEIATRLGIPSPHLLNRDGYDDDGYLCWEYIEDHLDVSDPTKALAQQSEAIQNQLAQLKKLFKICYENTLYLDLRWGNLRLKPDGTVVPVYFLPCKEWNLEEQIQATADGNQEIFDYLNPTSG